MRSSIEIFHLLFCKSFLSGADKQLIVLKGGCNLRFFFGSNRYSEDIDFDVQTIARQTLLKRVEKVLVSPSFRKILASKKITLQSYSSPKQTETVQRWKLSLVVQNIDVPTKIEFSRRGIDHEGTGFDGVDPMLLGSYAISPLYMAHYDVKLAIKQKVDALVGRSQTQARDIYDLHLLMSRHPNVLLQLPADQLQKATEAAMSIDYDQFRGQVIEFLTEDARSFYSSRRTWDELQSKTIAMLEELDEIN